MWPRVDSVFITFIDNSSLYQVVSFLRSNILVIVFPSTFNFNFSCLTVTTRYLLWWIHSVVVMLPVLLSLRATICTWSLKVMRLIQTKDSPSSTVSTVDPVSWTCLFLNVTEEIDTRHDKTYWTRKKKYLHIHYIGLHFRWCWSEKIKYNGLSIAFLYQVKHCTRTEIMWHVRPIEGQLANSIT